MAHTIRISGIACTLLIGCSSADPSTTGIETTTASTTEVTNTGGSSGVATQSPTTDNPNSESSPTDGSDSTDPWMTTSEGPTGGTTMVGSATDAGTSSTSLDSSTGMESSGESTQGLEPDEDGDGVPDAEDNCPMVPNPDQADADKNGVGDACEDDDDDDDDGVPDAEDNCPLVPNKDQKDLDKDGIGDACDPDIDGDGVLEPDDNCPLVPNKGQEDLDKDGIGDLCDEDIDGDSIPNDDDVFPENGDQPGVVTPKKIYAHSSGVLSTVDVVDYTVTTVGPFKWPMDGGSHQMTDVAIDRYGVLYGVTFERAYVCNPVSAQCFVLGELPGSYNGLTWIPAGTLDPNKDSLIGITNNGTWNHLKIMNGQVQAVQLGSYGAGYSSAGDAFSIEGVGTFAAVNKNGKTSTIIVTVDPLNGKILSELAVTEGYNSVFGLAGWEGLILAFDSSKQMIKIDPKTKVVTNLGNKGVAWWGAGVGTILPQ